MKRIVRLTESDLVRLVKRVISEQAVDPKIIYYPRDLGDILSDGNPISKYVDARFNLTAEGRKYLTPVFDRMISPSERKYKIVRSGPFSKYGVGSVLTFVNENDPNYTKGKYNFEK